MTLFPPRGSPGEHPLPQEVPPPTSLLSPLARATLSRGLWLDFFVWALVFAASHGDLQGLDFRFNRQKQSGLSLQPQWNWNLAIPLTCCEQSKIHNQAQSYGHQSTSPIASGRSAAAP